VTETRAVWTLAVTQTLGYACFFYVFAALILYWQKETGFSKGLLAAGPMLAIIVSAFLAPAVGRAVDRGRAVALLTAGPVVGAGALILLAMTAAPAGYLLAWAGLGAAQALCLYDVCFGLLIRRYGTTARGAITRVTLVAGLASTLAFPAGAALAEGWGWRVAVWVAVGMAVGVMLPLQAWAARVVNRGVPQALRDRVQVRVRWAEILREPGFVALAAFFALINLGHWMLVNHLRPILEALDIPSAIAVAAAAAIGPAQVLGRLALMGAGARMPTGRAAVLTVVAMVLAPMALIAAAGWPVLAFGFAALQGAAMGVLTILRPVLVAEVLGQERYGAVSGMMAIPGLAASAAAAPVGAILMLFGGPFAVLGVAVCLGLGAAGAVAARR
jgi:predicted MFS family arabinose efflux permease